jgi:hypothetical protein
LAIGDLLTIDDCRLRHSIDDCGIVDCRIGESRMTIAIDAAIVDCDSRRPIRAEPNRQS